MVEFGKFTLKLFARRRAGEQGVPGPDPQRPLPPRDLLDGPGGREEPGQLLRRQGARRGSRTARSCASTRPRDYLNHIAEHVEPWSYLKFPYLKAVGWKGFVDGKDSGVYRATPQSRLNAADGMNSPLAQEAYEEYFETLTGDRSGKKPVHHTLAIHWARCVELLNAAEHALELVQHPEITHPENFRVVCDKTPAAKASGIVEAPRGTLTHHYVTDENGIVKKANLIVGTTNNHAAICMSIKKAAQGLINKGVEVTEGVLNMVEMAFRAYDPCFGCATHSLPGQMPLIGAGARLWTERCSARAGAGRRLVRRKARHGEDQGRYDGLVSAAGSPGCRPRWTWPSRASTCCWWRRSPRSAGSWWA